MTSDYYLINKDRIKKNRRIKIKYLIKNDINFKLKISVEQKRYTLTSRKIKYGTIIELLGCTIPEYKRYIENKFKPNMNWQNYGKGKDKWCIDHIIPCCLFDMNKEEDQRKCFHYTNTQPLWFIENQIKSYKQ